MADDSAVLLIPSWSSRLRLPHGVLELANGRRPHASVFASVDLDPHAAAGASTLVMFWNEMMVKRLLRGNARNNWLSWMTNRSGFVTSYQRPSDRWIRNVSNGSLSFNS